MKPIAVSGCTLAFSKGEGLIQVTSIASTNVKVNGNGAYIKELSFTVTGYTDVSTGFTGGIGRGSVRGTSKKSSYNKEAFVLEGDSVKITLEGIDTSGKAATVSATVYVKDAGQSIAKTV